MPSLPAGHRPIRSLGQNFLIDEEIADMQVEAAGILPDDRVLEIGPGTGILSSRIIRQLKGGHYFAIEKDKELHSALEKEFGHPENVTIISADALKTDWPSFDVMVSNIPYNISTSFTMKLLSSQFRTAVIMYQKEFVARLSASPGGKDYGRLSVYAYMRAEIEKIADVPASAFYPVPAVDSAVLRITPRPVPFETDMKLFEEVTMLIFSRRRKKIKNCLLSLTGRFGLEKSILSSMPYSHMRAEQLSPRQINEIVEWLVLQGD